MTKLRLRNKTKRLKELILQHINDMLSKPRFKYAHYGLSVR